ncbi:MAG: DUF3035 domain-containing protein [Pseudobdellovibrionaceae bacterium]
MMVQGRVVWLAGLAACLLTGCEDVKDQLGLSRRTPDEFAVMERAPLEVPQDLSQLPQPNPGALRPQETPATQMAKSAVLGDGQVTALKASPAENALLQKTGAEQSSSAIRAVVNREAQEETEDNRSTVKKLLDIGSEHKAATVVDPEAEAKRIQDAKKKGEKVTGEGTPTVEE